MTLKMVAGVISLYAEETIFFDDSSIEVINENTEGHYRELPDGRMILGGDVIEASKKWVLELPVTGLKARGNNLIIYVDG